jgi:hypothetical protein
MNKLSLALVVTLVFSATSAKAVQSNSGGMSFECSQGDVPIGKCSCAWPSSSYDCKQMEEYCDGEISCRNIDYCECTAKDSSMHGVGTPVKSVPAGGIGNPGRRPPAVTKVVPSGSIHDSGVGLPTQVPSGKGGSLRRVP